MKTGNTEITFTRKWERRFEMNLTQFCHDFGVPFTDKRAGWVNIHCPFCSGSRDFHLGYSLQDDYFTCWRCGWKPKEKVIAALASVSQAESKKLINRYGGISKSFKNKRSAIIEIKRKGLKHPSRTAELTNAHKRYLKSRGFDPEYIVERYKIQGTGPASSLDGLDMKWRLIIPIFFKGREVSWQSRSIRDARNKKQQKLKYITCGKERERIFHKELLYNYDNAKKQDWCVVCEGILDVWRLGTPAVATFGTKYKMKQVRLLKKFKIVFIAFDPDPAGQENAKKLKAQLEWAGVKVHIIENMPCDPGDMKQEYANGFMKHLKETAEVLR